MKSWVEISEDRLTGNYRALQQAAGADMPVLAVVKANAYGHGLEVCAPVLARAGASWLGVGDAAEGVRARGALAAGGMAGEQQPRILTMCGLVEESAEAIVRNGLTPVVWDVVQLEWLSAAVDRCGGGGPLAVHVEIDTGMARQGVQPGPELERVLRWFAGQASAGKAGLRVEAVMTHFASAEVAASAQTLRQRRKFEQAMGQIAEAGVRPEVLHVGNSSTIDNDGAAEGEGSSVAWLRRLAAQAGSRAMVRAGIGLYGYCLEIERAQGDLAGVRGLVQAGLVQAALQPVMTWKTQVLGLREIGAGDTVGYNGTFVAERPMRLALLAVGYADGLRRELSSTNARAGGWVMLRGQRAAIIGRVSMNLTVVDVTAIAKVAVGDEAIVLGDGITAEDHARLAGTISYEIVCGVRAGVRLGDSG